MELNEIVDLTLKLIAIPSNTRSEQKVIDFLRDFLGQFATEIELIEVTSERKNLFLSWGRPKIVFTTHIDTVPGSTAARVDAEKIYGRGACDAKGIAATMIGVISQLLKSGQSDFGLLLVVGEEEDGIGALRASRYLQGRGIEYIINGEPTENKLMLATKGGLGGQVAFTGRAAHSGYPELAVDANNEMLNFASSLAAQNFGQDNLLGPATINFGLIAADNQPNVISDYATLSFLVRTVSSNADVLAKIQTLCLDGAKLSIDYNVPAIKLMTLPGFDTAIAAYATDIPNFSALEARAILYGPGSIQQAHTANEWIEIGSIQQAVTDYQRIFTLLVKQHSHTLHRH
ncbi:M20/M25/M40 family metallo-hydrolase [bacterium]|nr:M20/M25/M40 family metallo-hydrolase [bacterium]